MLASDVETLLNSKDKLLTQIYFDLQRHFEAKYGVDTVVFMEIGTFFEVYEINNDEEQVGKAKEIAELLNIQLTKKNKSILENSDKNPLLAGVPAVSFERYLSRLIAEQKYTVIVVKQKGNPPKISRYISQIVSLGTNFDHIIDNDDNYIVSILVDKHRDVYIVGYSAIDVTMGKTWLYESHGTSEDPSYALDELFNLLNVYRTSEVVVTFLDGADDQRHVMHYLEIAEHYHYSVNHQRPRIEFQNELFREVYQIQSLLSPIEHLDLERSPMITESLAILIHFVIEHDIHIVQKLDLPKIIDNRRFMYLGNNAFEQMSVISKDRNELTLLKLLDKSSTALGRRLLKERLLNPIIEKEELERRYNLVEKVSSHVCYLDEVMRGIYDLERLSRRLYLGRLHPFEINHIYDSMQSVKELIGYAKKHKIQKIPFHESEVEEFLRDISKTIDLDISRRFTHATIDDNFLMSGVDEAIDTLVKENQTMLIAYIADLDVGVSSSKVAQTYKHTRPMIVDDDFLEMANKIRKRLAKDFDELELLVKKKTSKYNKELYVTKCVICGAMAEDVHHINHQSLADSSGFIGHFHKDAKHNLVPLYKEHHKAIHDGSVKIDGFVMTSSGLELKFEERLSKKEAQKPIEPEINEPKGSVLDDWD